MKDSVREAYKLLANDYELNVDTQSVYNIYYERPSMMDLIPTDLKEMKVFDAGCAAGWYTDQLIRLGAEVVASDISPEMVAATKRRVGKKAEVLCLDIDGNLPFADESFDLIICSLVLHYVEDWTQVFAEFRRILKPKGKLLFSVHHPFMDLKLSEKKDYFSTELIVDTWKRQGKLIKVPFFRRSLQTILNDTLKYFYVDKILEPQPTYELKVKEAEAYEKLMKNPHFLIIKAEKFPR